MQCLVKVVENTLLQFCCEVWSMDDEYTSSQSMNEDSKDEQKQTTAQPTQKKKKILGDSREVVSNININNNNNLLRLPAELQTMIFQNLTFGEVESLRRTCRALRYSIDKSFIRFIFPDLKVELLSTCYQCLRNDPERESLIKASKSDARYPLANECIECVASRGGFFVGRAYTLGSLATVCVCRYCGFPVTEDAAWKEYEFHRRCYRRYRVILLYYFLGGFAQSTISVVASALCWRYYKGETMIITPTIVSARYII
ncbi:uncharacterized protein B0J16DRAFT_173246 [Fusarium flagelliforme]|uniref:uncharacterized protein n=1 Tax=Fusarium flagelliforme TaxID=2675880 RepID=UPI001E8E4BA4|nr:uncharacterized protein B0J16DRAFT_173246 [Fusarium flagelliforme]KAH7179565.1 hypothetical protein B0J16DRAFT_173246 [Fusarium flagelliforme]